MRQINYPISRRHDFDHILVVHFREGCGFTPEDVNKWFKDNKIPYQNTEKYHTWDQDPSESHFVMKFKFKNPGHAMRFKLAFSGEYEDTDKNARLD